MQCGKKIDKYGGKQKRTAEKAYIFGFFKKILTRN
jgi:hypothetical protein